MRPTLLTAVALAALACTGLARAEAPVKAKPAAAGAHKAAVSAPAVDDLKAKAEAGDAQAQVGLGELLHGGRGVARDEAAAAKWFGKAAAQGSAQGLAALGLLYLTGSGVPADAAKAAELTRQAADKGLAPASYNLGLMYLKGQGVAADRAQAMVWLRQAAEAKYADAQYALGMLNAGGGPGQQNGVEAVKWLSLAAAGGSAELRANALARIKTIAAVIGPDRTQEGLEAARIWLFSHS